MSVNSSQQLGSYSNFPTAPLSLGQSTTGSVASRTAWRSHDAGAQVPAAYSKKTRQTTLNWDDNSSGPSLPESDKGAKFLGY